jgi:hypothetical protein
VAIGDKQADVRACVNQVLITHGAPPPMDPTGTMSGTYHYAKQNMYSFHRQVKECLQTKHHNYKYDETDDYMQQTVGMTVREIYNTISMKTDVPAGVTAMAPEAAGVAAMAPVVAGNPPKDRARKSKTSNPKAKSKPKTKSKTKPESRSKKRSSTKPKTK